MNLVFTSLSSPEDKDVILICPKRDETSRSPYQSCRKCHFCHRSDNPLPSRLYTPLFDHSSTTSNDSDPTHCIDNEYLCYGFALCSNCHSFFCGHCLKTKFDYKILSLQDYYHQREKSEFPFSSRNPPRLRARCSWSCPKCQSICSCRLCLKNPSSTALVRIDSKKSSSRKIKQKQKKQTSSYTSPPSTKKKKRERPQEQISQEQISQELYEVEKILGKREQGERVQYLVKWKGYSDLDNSWEEESNIDAPECIAYFHSAKNSFYFQTKPFDFTPNKKTKKQ